MVTSAGQVRDETIAGELLINGVGSGDSNRSLGNHPLVVPYDKSAGVPKRVGGYLQPFVGPSEASSDAERIARISAIVQPIQYAKYGLIFGCNEKPSTEACGKIRAKIMCKVDQSHPSYFKHERCNDPGCPVCYPKFARRIANAVVERVQGYRSEFGYDPIYHLVFWPDILTGYSNLKQAFKDAQLMLKKMGAKMAVVWYHPYRIRDEIKEQLRIYRIEHGIAKLVGFWQMAHDDVLGLGSLSAYIEYGPHFHAIASGYLVNAKEYANLGIGGYKKVRVLPLKADLEHVAYYISTHACREFGKSTVRYFGGISYRMLTRDDGVEVIEDVVCEKCGGNMQSFHCDDIGNVSGLIHTKLTRKVIQYKYWARSKKKTHSRHYTQDYIRLGVPHG